MKTAERIELHRSGEGIINFESMLHSVSIVKFKQVKIMKRETFAYLPNISYMPENTEVLNIFSVPNISISHLSFIILILNSYFYLPGLFNYVWPYSGQQPLKRLRHCQTSTMEFLMKTVN